MADNPGKKESRLGQVTGLCARSKASGSSITDGFVIIRGNSRGRIRNSDSPGGPSTPADFNRLRLRAGPP
jgi:hypothetical protein